MASRERSTMIRCADGGCNEVTHISFSNQTERREIYRRQIDKPWKCNRHRNPAENLRPGNETTSYVVVATRLKRKLDRWAAANRQPEDCEPGYAWLGMFWVAEGGSEGGNSGFAYGPGFNAYAEDFPEGTRLVVTATIQLPGEGGGPDA